MSATAEHELGSLLEREQALDTLRDALADATTGQGGVVVVSGEAGIGKTALLRAFCEGSCGDARVLWGACDPLFTPRPLGPLHEIAHSAADGLPKILGGDAVPFDVAMALLRELGRDAPTLLDLAVDYRACHRFERTSTS